MPTSIAPEEIAAKELPLHSWLLAVFLGFSLPYCFGLLVAWSFAPACQGDLSPYEAMHSSCQSPDAVFSLSVMLGSVVLLLAIVAFAHRHRFMKVWRVAMVAGATGALLMCATILDQPWAAASSAVLTVLLLAAHFALKRVNFVVPQAVSIPAIIVAILIYFISSLSGVFVSIRSGERPGTDATNNMAPSSYVSVLPDLPAATDAASPRIGPDAAFTRVDLECGVAVSYPKHWRTLGADADLNIRARAEAIGSVPLLGRRTLLLLSSTPPGAQLRLVAAQRPPELNDSAIAELARDETALQTLADAFSNEFRRQAASGGPHLIAIQRPRVVIVDNRPAVHISYSRSDVLDEAGEWRVDQYQIPISSTVVYFTISFRASERHFWKPILDASLASLDVGAGC